MSINDTLPAAPAPVTHLRLGLSTVAFAVAWLAAASLINRVVWAMATDPVLPASRAQGDGVNLLLLPLVWLPHAGISFLLRHRASRLSPRRIWLWQGLSGVISCVVVLLVGTGLSRIGVISGVMDWKIIFGLIIALTLTGAPIALRLLTPRRTVT